MRKKVLLALAVSMTVLGVLTCWLSPSSRETPFNKMRGHLKYYVQYANEVSLNPLNSDAMANGVPMKHLIGTLVRYSNGGQFEPYIAEQFHSSENNRVWKFSLRSDLRCHDGEAITAKGYIEGLLRLLPLYASEGPLPMFAELLGWNDFLEGGPLTGLSASKPNEVLFRFTKSVGPGFLEYLSMSYYGYYCASNFSDGKWISQTNVVSSGPYRLLYPVTEHSPLELIVRDDWPLVQSAAPERVTYYTNIPASAWNQRNTIIQASLGWTESNPKEFRRIWGPPDLIRSIILDPEGPSTLFVSEKARRLFQAKVLEIRSRRDFAAKDATLAHSFYAGSNFALAKPLPESYNGRPSKKLRIFIPSLQNDETSYVTDLITDTLHELAWDFDIFSPHKNNGINAKDIMSRTKFDIRVSNVVAGSVAEPWVVEMMFCSNLGVSFPDPSKKICALVDKILNRAEPFSAHEAGAAVSKIVYEDAAVIPIYHGRSTWYFSDDLDVSKISGDLILPSFEDIGITE